LFWEEVGVLSDDHQVLLIQKVGVFELTVCADGMGELDGKLEGLVQRDRSQVIDSWAAAGFYTKSQLKVVLPANIIMTFKLCVAAPYYCLVLYEAAGLDAPVVEGEQTW